MIKIYKVGIQKYIDKSNLLLKFRFPSSITYVCNVQCDRRLVVDAYVQGNRVIDVSNTRNSMEIDDTRRVVGQTGVRI